MNTSIEPPPAFEVATKFVPAQRVISIRSLVKAPAYRAWTLGILQKLRVATAAAGRASKDNPFAIMHNHLYWDRDIDLEACMPVTGWNSNVGGFQVRVVPAARVALTRISRTLNDPLDRTIQAFEALEEYVRNEDLIFSGDPREAYSAQTGLVELQLPVYE